MKNNTVKTFIFFIVCGVVLLSLVEPSPTLAQRQAQSVGALRITANTLEISPQRWVASGGRPQARSVDGRYDIQADKIVVELNPKATQRQDQVASASATGSVTVKVRLPDRSADVRATRAVYNASSDTLVFEGAVNAVLTDPQFEEPTRLNAQKVTMWLSAGPADTQIKVEGGPAVLEVTPKEEKKN